MGDEGKPPLIEDSLYDGDDQAGFGWAGQVAGLIHDIPTVDELIKRMVAEASAIRIKWGKTKR